jgi:2-succinyl-6-hydroxy-2,4-cyclohexadiene-1-carboxylate synthase
MSRVVLVHGFTQTGASWATIAAGLPDHEVLTPDQPGHGSRAADRADLPSSADDLAPLGPAAFVGYSMGARIALHLALRHPGAVTRLVLLGGTAGIDDEAERAARRHADEALADRLELIGTDAFLDEWLAQPLFAGLPDGGRGARSRDASGMAWSLRLAGTGTQEPLWDRLGEVAVPVLVVAGERDAKFRALGERLAAGLPDAELAIVPGAGHAAHLERPEAFLAILRPWLH